MKSSPSKSEFKPACFKPYKKGIRKSIPDALNFKIIFKFNYTKKYGKNN